MFDRQVTLVSERSEERFIFSGLDIILIGDFQQLPPIQATAIYKQLKQNT